MSTQGDVLASPAQREPRTSMSVQLFTVEDELKSSPDTTLGKLKATFGSCELAGTAGMGAGRLAERLSLYGIVPKGAHFFTLGCNFFKQKLKELPSFLRHFPSLQRITCVPLYDHVADQALTVDARDRIYRAYAEQLCDVSGVLSACRPDVVLEYHCYSTDLTPIYRLSKRGNEVVFPVERLCALYRQVSSDRRENARRGEDPPVHADIDVQLDAYFAGVANASMIGLLNRLKGQVASIHLNGIDDQKRQATLADCVRNHADESEDWNAIVTVATDVGVTDFVVEHHSSLPAGPLGGVSMALRSGVYLASLLGIPLRGKTVASRQ